MGGVNVIQSEEIGSAFKLARLDELTRSQAKYSNVPNLPIPSHHLLYSFQDNTTVNSHLNNILDRIFIVYC